MQSLLINVHSMRLRSGRDQICMTIAALSLADFCCRSEGSRPQQKHHRHASHSTFTTSQPLLSVLIGNEADHQQSSRELTILAICCRRQQPELRCAQHPSPRAPVETQSEPLPPQHQHLPAKMANKSEAWPQCRMYHQFSNREA